MNSIGRAAEPAPVGLVMSACLRRSEVAAGPCPGRGGPAARAEGLYCMALGQLECLGDDLVHVVVAVSTEPSQERDARGLLGELLVLPVESPVLGSWHRVVRVAGVPRELVHDTGLGVSLTGEVPKFGDAGVGVVVGIVDDGCGLEPLGVMRLEPKLERSVRERPVAEVEELIDGA